MRLLHWPGTEKKGPSRTLRSKLPPLTAREQRWTSTAVQPPSSSHSESDSSPECSQVLPTMSVCTQSRQNMARKKKTRRPAKKNADVGCAS